MTVSAKNCVTYRSTTGGACSAAEETGALPFGNLEIAFSPPSTWNSNPGEYAFVYVELPARDGDGGVSVLKGYYTISAP